MKINNKIFFLSALLLMFALSNCFSMESTRNLKTSRKALKTKQGFANHGMEGFEEVKLTEKTLNIKPETKIYEKINFRTSGLKDDFEFAEDNQKIRNYSFCYIDNLTLSSNILEFKWLYGGGPLSFTFELKDLSKFKSYLKTVFEEKKVRLQESIKIKKGLTFADPDDFISPHYDENCLIKINQFLDVLKN